MILFQKFPAHGAVLTLLTIILGVGPARGSFLPTSVSSDFKCKKLGLATAMGTYMIAI